MAASKVSAALSGPTPAAESPALSQPTYSVILGYREYLGLGHLGESG
jgi:hypothetical protein